MHFILGTSFIDWRYIGLALLGGIAVFIVVEVEKFITRKTLYKEQMNNIAKE